VVFIHLLSEKNPLILEKTFRMLLQHELDQQP